VSPGPEPPSRTACGSISSASGAPAQEEKDWQPDPPPPMPEKYDWIQLTSDEWLKDDYRLNFGLSFDF
jgi:hypothetical protein